MKIIRYSDLEIETLRKMLGNTAKRLTYSFTQIRIEFLNFYVQFDVDIDSAVSSMGGAEIMHTKPVWAAGQAPDNNTSESMGQNLPIDEIEIIETMLYWRVINKSDVKPLHTGNPNLNRAVNNLLKKSALVTEQLLIKPSFLRKLLVPSDYLNIADVGIRIKSGNNYFVIAPTENSYGFNENSWISIEDYKERISSSYRYKKINHH